jgi:subtilisin family serine protease
LACALTLLVLLLACASAPAGATHDDAEHDGPDFSRYLTIRFAEGTSNRQRLAVRQAVGATFELSLDGPLLQQASIPGSGSTAGAAAALERDPNVVYAVASGSYRGDDIPDPYFNDGYLPQQWALHNTGQVFMSRLVNGQFEEVRGTPGADIGAPAAWDALSLDQRSNGVTIGVIDTGVAYQHPDLAGNMVPGSDFFDADSDPRDINGHGTHAASVAAGVAGNTTGIAGVDPWAKVMPLRAADENGDFSWAAIEQAVAYGLARGVRVFNGSFSGPDDDPVIEDLIARNPQALFVFSAGNGGSDQIGDNHDGPSGLAHRYPCDAPAPNIICVGASDWNDAITSFSDHGATSVDLLAPGAGVYAAKPCTVPAPDAEHQTECPYDAADPWAPVGLGGGPFAFQLLSGTSMAAPAVSGVAALLWQKCPLLRASQVKSAIVGNVDQFAVLRTKVAYGGRLDAGAAVASVAACPAPSSGTDWPVPPPPPSPPGGNDGSGSSGTGGGTTGPTGGVKPGPLSFQIVRPAVAKVGRRNAVTFKLVCSERCSASVTAAPRSTGVRLKQFKVAVPSAPRGTRTVVLKLPSAQLRLVRRQLSARRAVRLRLSVVVSDQAGLASRPVAFTLRLAR